MLELEQKARWLRPVGQSLPRAVTQRPKKASSRVVAPARALPAIVEYKQALDKLDAVEAELAEWLNAPWRGASRRTSRRRSS